MLTIILFILIVAPSVVLGQELPRTPFRVERNVVYGMYSGLSLLMDVYYPPKPNGYGIIFIAGSAFYAPLSYDDTPLKENSQVQMYAKPLLAAGYTVFAINHRDPPRFRHPAAVEDAQRAVRYIRYHAKEFGIGSERVGAAGGSSGAYLVDMLGVLDGKGDPADPDPVNRESAKVQCVVARAAPIDWINLVSNRAAFVDIMGMRVEIAGKMLPPTSVEYKSYREASPLFYLSKDHLAKDNPPFLLLHGDADQLVVFKNSEVMEEALKKAGVEVKLLRIPGGNHGPDFPGAKNPPDYIGEMVRWFDQHLGASATGNSTPDSAPQESSVRQTIAEFVEAFNSRDRARLAQVTTADMDRRSNQNGEIIVLADAKQGTPVMNNPRDDQRWTREIDKVRFITPEVALVDTHGDETRSSNDTGRTVRHVFNSYVVKKDEDGKWRIAASRY